MKAKFTETTITEIESALETKFSQRGDQFRTILENPEHNRRLTLEINSEIPIGDKTGNLISVFTSSAHAQLHFCTGFVASEVLGEVVFIGKHNDRLSGIIVEKAAAFSIYSNIEASLLSSDFTKLGPEVMVSGVALSLAEHLLEENTDS